MNDIYRAGYLKVVAETHARISQGISNDAQLARLLAELSKIKWEKYFIV